MNEDKPQSIGPQRIHKPLPINIRKRNRLPNNPRIRKKHIQPSILPHRIINDRLNGGFIARVEVPDVHVDTGV